MYYLQVRIGSWTGQNKCPNSKVFQQQKRQQKQIKENNKRVLNCILTNLPRQAFFSKFVKSLQVKFNLIFHILSEKAFWNIKKYILLRVWTNIYRWIERFFWGFLISFYYLKYMF